MALTKTDLQQIRHVVDESIAAHPRFNEIEGLMLDMKSEIIGEIVEVNHEMVELIDKRFNNMEIRLDNLRIVSR